MTSSDFSFWYWFLKGGEERPGWLRLLDRWLALHALIGVGLGLVVKKRIGDVGEGALLPLAGVLVGLSFAWSGNALALLQTPEIERVARHQRGGLRDYVYTFQLSILVLLVTICAWGIASLGVFEITWPGTANVPAYRSVASLMYGLTSLAIRECWQVVMGGQWLLILRGKVREGDEG
jgi:hypothetical protein